MPKAKIKKPISAQTVARLRKRFPKLTAAAARKYASLLVPLFARKGDGPDYSQPGEWGQFVEPHIIFVRRSADGEWEEIPLKPWDRCDQIVLEADVRISDAPCPPTDGFASMLKAAEKQARDMAPDCGWECEGTWVETIYKKWYCQEGDAVAIVQVRRLSYVI